MADNGEGGFGVVPKGLYPVFDVMPSVIGFPQTDQNLPPFETDQRQASRVEIPPGDAAAQSHSYTCRPLMVPHSHQPSIRQSSCNHGTVTRQYSIDEYETCENCGRRPFLNWFYLCNEDTSGFSDPIDPDGSLLNPWIIDAILAGHYTEDQRELLIQQKLEVLRMREKEICLSIHSMSIVKVEDELNLSQIGVQEPSPLGTPQARASLAQGNEQTIILKTESEYIHSAPCSYRACHHCDRKLQERTWLSIDEICDGPSGSPPSAWDLWDRPVSEARIVGNLGLPLPPPHAEIYGPHVTRSSWIGHGLRVNDLRNRSTLNLQSILSTIEEAGEGTDIDTGEIEECSIDDLRNDLEIPLIGFQEGPNHCYVRP